MAICTRDRAESLRRLLSSLREMDVPPDVSWEVVVVDNGSSDHTRKVVAEFAGELPLTYAFEGKSGLSHARNHAVGVARGRYLCWTDDDATVDRAWLATYAAAFRTYPDAAVFGGRIVPVIEGPSPKWFVRHASQWPLTGLLACRDFGDAPQPVDFSRDVVPWGVNYAIRATEQRRRLYDPSLGVSPNQRRSAEEAQVIFDIMREGATGWWLPDCVVHHHFPPERQTFRSVFEHYWALGESKAYLDDTREHHLLNQGGREAWLSKMSDRSLLLYAVGNLLAFAVFRLSGATLRAICHLRKAGLYTGVHSYKIARSKAAGFPGRGARAVGSA